MTEPRSVMPRVVGVIPARLNSSRLPRKVLLPIAGKPMIYWVYMNVVKSPLLHSVVIATDSREVADICAELRIPSIVTGSHPTGTDRLFEVTRKTDADIYVNVQGDEPTVNVEHIRLLVQPLIDDQNLRVSTLCVEISNDEAANPNAVKVVKSISNKALYFSRSPIPYNTSESNKQPHFKHIGLYAYRRDALSYFHTLNQTPLELSESLEQLRLLENGETIYVATTNFDTIGIDTQADYDKVVEMYNLRGSFLP